jgi:hypothetical protein
MGPVRYVLLGFASQYGSIQGRFKRYMDVVDSPGRQLLGLSVIQILDLGPAQVLNPGIPRIGLIWTLTFCS